MAGTYAPAEATTVIGGNSYLISPLIDSLTATDNQVVLDTSDPLVGGMIQDFVPGTGSPAFDTGSAYTIVYQLANNGGGLDPVLQLAKIEPHANVTSYGYIPNWGMTDAGSPVGILENMGVDSWPADTGGLPRWGGSPGFVKSTGAYITPTTCGLVTSEGTEGIAWTFDPDGLLAGVGVERAFGVHDQREVGGIRCPSG